MRIIRLWANCFLLVSLGFTYAFTQENNTLGLFDVLYGETPTEVTINMPLDSVLEGRRTNNYYHGSFSFIGSDGEKISLKLKVRARGRYRRSRCDFPPLKLNFSKSELHRHGWAYYDKFKLVTHCSNAKFTGNSNLIKEYLVYKLYNQISDSSYRVQLLKINYVDTISGKKLIRFGFILEPNHQLEERIQASKFKDFYNMSSDSYDLVNENRQALFQYMIGNEDWNSKTSHNVKIMKPNRGEGAFLVPYDFDFSGLVATDYARPQFELGLKSITDRYFLGYAVGDEILNENISFFISIKGQLLDVVDKCIHLQKHNKKLIKTYINNFYNSLDYLPNIVEQQGRALI
ncbi:MAG: hypothetical protein HRU40_12435 [Saprospiraceae bacterium]|nr:hypothetical protein [Saprospiraceae bacterium]